MRFVCPPDHAHGDRVACYSNHGCKCASCYLAAQDRRRAERKTCARCPQTVTGRSPLCRDCRSVLTKEERELWEVGNVRGTSYPQEELSPSVIEDLFDTMEGQRKNGPAGAPTPETPGLATDTVEETVTMTSVTDATRNTRQDIACEYLALTREHIRRAEKLRVYYMRLAREYGLTNQAIGDALGVTESAVRSMLARAE